MRFALFTAAVSCHPVTLSSVQCHSDPRLPGIDAGALLVVTRGWRWGGLEGAGDPAARLDRADEALRVGLINRIVSEEDLELEVRRYAETIAANAPLTVHAAKVALREGERDPPVRDLTRVDALVNACFDSDDYLEGRRAFAEKRQPNFHGT